MPDDRWVLTFSRSHVLTSSSIFIFIFIIYHLLRFLPSFLRFPIIPYYSLLFPIIPLPFQADGLTELSSAEDVRWEV
jgi:hypothetical protein